jgi:hypothetical protein
MRDLHIYLCVPFSHQLIKYKNIIAERLLALSDDAQLDMPLPTGCKHHFFLRSLFRSRAFQLSTIQLLISFILLVCFTRTTVAAICRQQVGMPSILCVSNYSKRGLHAGTINEPRI